MMDRHFFWMGWGMWLFPLAAILIIALASRNNRISESPMEILEKRYAKGEISKEQFEQMKKDLSQ